MILSLILAAASTLLYAAPNYTSASIVNSATGLPILAPNTFASIYGSGLAFTTRALQPSDLFSSTLPTTLPGTGVSVLVNNIPAAVFFVSPEQVNFLIPPILLPGPARVVLALNGLSGPEAQIRLTPSAPGLFLLNPDTVLAVRLNGTLLTPITPPTKAKTSSSSPPAWARSPHQPATSKSYAL